MILEIELSRLEPNPLNPRKHLGGLEGFASIIKVQGFKSVLTVIAMDGTPTQRGRGRPRKDEPDARYMIVLGHRRAAAAKLAGLESVPCSVVEMTEAEQVAAMLGENMQRENLTVIEEADGFQTMLDLGATVEDLTERTGMSRRTIGRRLGLLELDRARLEAAEARGGTLSDYIELEKIKNPELKNQVLESIGTPDFRWELRKALDAEAIAAAKERMIPILDSFAERIELDDSRRRSFVMRIEFTDGATVAVPGDADEREYLYMEDSSYATLYVARDDEDSSNAETEKERLRREDMAARKAGLSALHGMAYESRAAFAKGFHPAERHDAALHGLLIAALTGGSVRGDVFREIFGIEKAFRESWQSASMGESLGEAVARLLLGGETARRVLFALAWARVEPGRNAECVDWNDVYRPHEGLAQAYSLLGALGYEASAQERSMLDGNHALYLPPDGDDKDDDDIDEEDEDDRDYEGNDDDDDFDDGEHDEDGFIIGGEGEDGIEGYREEDEEGGEDT